MRSTRATHRPHVVIAGGGFAALEAAAALRALAEDRVRLTLVAPERRFHYRPAAPAEAFTEAPPLTYDLHKLLSGLDVSFEQSRLVSVMPREKWLRLASGRRLTYDALILTIGAQRRAGVPGALTFCGQRDVPKLRQALTEARESSRPRLVFAVPSLRSWSLPAYELALFTSAWLEKEGCWGEVTLVTPEREPLAVFGAEASRAVRELLACHEVRFVGGATPRRVRRDGAVELDFAGHVQADTVIALPELMGSRVSGIPASWLGFIPTDSAGRVEGLADVYAAGDITTFPVKQGGLAAQQADHVAHAIAAGMGLALRELRPTRILQAQLFGGPEPLFLRTELDGFGQPGASSTQRLEPASETFKVYARYLSPYLAQFTPSGARIAA